MKDLFKKYILVLSNMLIFWLFSSSSMASSLIWKAEDNSVNYFVDELEHSIFYGDRKLLLIRESTTYRGVVTVTFMRNEFGQISYPNQRFYFEDGMWIFGNSPENYTEQSIDELNQDGSAFDLLNNIARYFFKSNKENPIKQKINEEIEDPLSPEMAERLVGLIKDYALWASEEEASSDYYNPGYRS